MIQYKDDEWHDCLNRLSDYRDFLEMGFEHLLQDPDRLIYSFVHEVGSVKVGIAGLNSAWSCTDDDKAKLWLGGHWQIQTLGQKIGDADIRIALIHHPINWLTEFEDPTLGPEIERTFDFLLHGHEHQGWINRQNDNIRIAGGAAYDRSDKENGYNIVRLNLDQNTCEVWLRRYENQGGGWVAKNIYEKTNSQGVWLIENALRRIASSKKTSSTEDFQNELNEEFSTDEVKKIADSSKEVEPNSPESRGVFGRRQTLGKLSKQLQKNAILVVYGLGGIGKTDLIRESQHLPEYQTYRYIEVYAYPDTNLRDLYRPIAIAMGNREEDPTIPTNDFGFFDFSKLGDSLKLPTLVHVHRAHHLFAPRLDRDTENFFQALLKHVPNIKLILESRNTPPQHEMFTTLRVTGLDSDSVQQYFETKPLRTKPEVKWSLLQEEAEYIYSRLGGNYKRNNAHPLSLLLLATVADGQQTTPMDVLRNMEGLLWEELEEHLFHELYDTILSDAEKHLLRVCALYREPIPDLHVESLNAHVGTAAFDNLVNRCLLSPDERGENYSLHQIIAELTTKRIDLDSVEFFESHETIAEAWLSRVKHKSRISLPNLLAAGESAYHFTQAGRFDKLDNLSLTLLGQRKLLPVLDGWSNWLFEQKDSRNNRRILELIISIDPQNAKAHNFLGLRIEELTYRGNLEALDHFEIACALVPDHPVNVANLGRCYLARNEPHKFLSYMENMIEFNRRRVMKDNVVIAIYANTLQQVGREEDASKVRQTLIEKKSTHPAFYADEALYQRELKRYSKALEILKNAVRLGIENDYLRSIRADILDTMGDYAAASDLRLTQIKAGSTDAAFYNDQAIQYRNQKQIDKAYSIIDLTYKRGVDDAHTESVLYSIMKAEGDIEKLSHFRQMKIDEFSKRTNYYNEESLYQFQIGNASEGKRILALAEKREVSDKMTESLRNTWLNEKMED
ncbi:MAG: hypothetical protein CL608_03655 [Anaerolineaceae bacterium]|nr:hypothetical protein [Anaerolineaceae bacterium]